MARKKKGNSQQDIRKKITALESVLGQKKAAEKLGVSTSTLRNWKSGKSKPRDREQEKKLNRVFGQNKKKVTPEKYRKQIKKEKTKREVRKKQLEKQRRENPRLISLNQFIQQFEEEYIQVNILQDAGGEYVAIMDGEKGQFVSAGDIMSKRYGLPKGTKFVEVMGLYTNQYEDQENESVGDFHTSRFPILMRKEMDLQDALDYLESKFFETSKNVGKVKYAPTRFIGYKL